MEFDWMHRWSIFIGGTYGWMPLKPREEPEQAELIADLLIGVCKRECERLLRAKERIAPKDVIRVRTYYSTSWLLIPYETASAGYLITTVEHDWDAHDLEIWIALLVEVRALCGERTDG